MNTNFATTWVSQLQGKYLSTGSFLYPPSHSNPSWLWKCILKSQSIISKGACHRVHLNSSFSVWNSPWIPTLPDFIPLPSSQNTFPNPNLMVSDLFFSNCYWNFPLLCSLFDPLRIREVQKIKIHPHSQTNFIWTLSSNGLFSTSSAYKLISSQRTSLASSPLDSKTQKQLWKLNLNARLKLFLWKIAWDIVPSKARLNRVFPISPTDSLCPLCLSEVDSLPHLFFNYIFARVAWRTFFWPLDSVAWSSLNLPNWIKGIITPHISFSIPLAYSHLFQVFAIVLCDLLWFSRNKAIHEGVVLDVLTLANTIKKTSLEHAAAWKSLSPKPKAWSLPAAGFFKINFDIAIRDKFSAQAAVCRDSKGRIIKAISQISPPCDPKLGEALAALLAANLAVSLKLK
jgi:hypothetical protein